MSTLTLVRHGQARPFEQDSDRLSEMGEQQARRLGKWWAERGVRFDEIHSGTLARHVQTEALITGGAGIRDAAWNEYDADGLLHRMAPALADRDPAFAFLRNAFLEHRQAPDANRHFQRMFEYLTDRWLAGDPASAAVEPWADFQSRVRRAPQSIVDAKSGSRRVLVVTSGGPIATAVQTVLGAPDRTAIELNWRMRNCSISEFLFSQGRISLDLFNATPHLDASEVTYR